MDVKELRIGNYVSFILETNISEIEEIFLNDGYFIATKTNSERGIEDYNPIPLTEDWLLKFGIKNKVWGFELFKNDSNEYHISTENGDWIFIKHVHQLQNLYFALTGEELTIKEVVEN